MNDFKQRCIKLRKAGHTLPEIIKATGRPKTSVYSHIYKLPLSEEKLRLIRLASGIRARDLALSRKGKSKKNFRKFTKWNANNVTLLAHLIFDGTINRTSCLYNNRNITLINQVEWCMREIYDYKPKRYLNKTTGVFRIGYHNVELAVYLKNKSKQLLETANLLPRPLKREFIKTFFDDEGCVDFRPKRNLRQIRGYQKNIDILVLVKRLLGEFGIMAKIVRPNEVVIIRKENLRKFQDKINFSHGVRLNGQRSNSIWKKSLEKRVLLGSAIHSFKT